MTRRGAAGRVRRHPVRGRRRQGAGPGRRRRLHRRGRAARPRLQPARLPRRRRASASTWRTTTPRSAPRRALRALPHRALPGRHHHPGPDARAPAGRRARPPTSVANFLRATDHGGHRAGPGLRQVRRPPSRARGPGRPDRRGGGHGPGAAGRHRLDPRLARPSGAGERTGVGRRRRHRCRGDRAEHRPRPGRAGRGRRAGAGPGHRRLGGTGKSSGIVRCHYGIRSLAAMAWHALPVLEHAGRSWAPSRATAGPGTWSGWGRRTVGALRANVAMHQRHRVSTSSWSGHDTAQEMWPAAEPERLRRVRLRAAGRLRRRAPDGTGLRRRPPGGGAHACARTAPVVGARDGRGRGSRRCGSATGERIAAGEVVLAAGPWSVPLAAPSGSTCRSGPSGPRSCWSIPAGRSTDVPVFSDLVSLQYVRTEGTGVDPGGRQRPLRPRVGRSRRLPRAGRRRGAGPDDPEIRAPLPRPERRRLSSSYAGCYDVTPDYNPMISASPVEGLWLCAGFSGHGYKISPAVGELMADLITVGRQPAPRHRPSTTSGGSGSPTATSWSAPTPTPGGQMR